MPIRCKDYIELILIDKKVVRATCMRCGKRDSDYFIVNRASKFPVTIMNVCGLCAKKEGYKHVRDDREDADSGK